MKSSELLNEMKCYRVNIDGYTHFYIWKSNKNKNTYGTNRRCKRVMLICCYLLLWNRVPLPTTTINEEQLVAALRDILNGNNKVYLCFLKHGQTCCNLKPDLVNNIISKFQNTCFTCVRIIVWYEENAIIETFIMSSTYRLSGLDIWGHTYAHAHTHTHIITHRGREKAHII